MTNEQALETNKLIAEFMGRYWYDKPSRRPQACAPEAEPAINILKSKYHYSWDWLMPVCKKIIDMYKDNRMEIYTGLENVDIHKTYSAVVGFILFWQDESTPKHRWSNVKFPYDPMPKGKIIY